MRLIEAFAASESVIAILRARDAVFLGINPAFERVSGYRASEVIGRIPFELGLWPDPAFRVEIWTELRAERRAVEVPTRMICADGHEISGHLSVEFIEDDGEACVFCLLHVLPPGHALQVQERRDSLYRSLFMSASEGIYRSLPGGGFLDVNPAMARILGFESPAELLLAHGRDAAALYFDDDEERDLYAKLASDGQVERVRARMRRKDGRVIWVSENSRTIFGPDGSPRFFEGSLVDITSQVEAEQALQQSQALYQVLVDNSRDGVFLTQHGRVMFANPALAELLGYRQDELIGMDYMDLVMPDDVRDQNRRRSEREAGSRELQHYELHLRRRDGQPVLVEVRADAVEFRGEIASTGTLRDVTEERRRQRAIEQAERRYREVFENSPAGLFRSSQQGEIIEVNPMLVRMLGFDSTEQLRAFFPNIRDVYANPAERDGLVSHLLREGAFRNYETGLRTRSGGVCWVSLSVRVIQDNEGEAHFTGSVLDITERHAMQEALRQSESRYRTLVEHSQVGVFIMRDDAYVYVNQAFAAMLGYRDDEIRGRDYRELLSPDALMAAELRERLRESGEGGTSDFETCLVHRDGHRIFARVSNGPVILDGLVHLTGTVLDITRQREAEERLRFHATHDPLTGLPNRLLFNRRLTEAMLQSARQGGRDYAVLFLDLDGFKWVNDSLGHGAGDRLLLEIARRLEDRLVKDVLIARYGGDEFTLLPDGVCDRARAIEVAEKIVEVFEQPFLISGQKVFSSASVGIVIGRPQYDNADQILRDADTAMYRAKAAGKSGYVIFDEAMHQQALHRLQLETDLRLALERSEFRLHYQPIIDVETGDIVGAEALVRWQHPARGLLAPADFLPVAEETGLIAELDNWVLEHACAQLADWRERFGHADRLRMNVNVDERQMSMPGIVREVERLVGQYALPPERLRLEVTETAFRFGRGLAEKRLRALKAVGVGLVVDDFGTGYSSLESFAASPFDALKIDQVFVRDVDSNPRHRAIVRTMTAFARELGLALTAEGVETRAQLDLLRALGCEQVQGFLYSRPVPPDVFEGLLQRGRIEP